MKQQNYKYKKVAAFLAVLVAALSVFSILPAVSVAAAENESTIYPGGSLKYELYAPEMELGALSAQVYYDTSVAEVSNMYIHDFAGADSPSIAPYSNYVYGQNYVLPEEHISEGTVVFSVTFNITAETSVDAVITGESDILLVDDMLEVHDKSNGVTSGITVLDYGTPPEPEPEPATEPVTEPVTEPEPATEPVTEPVTEPEPATEPVTEPVTEPEPATEPVTEPAGDPTVDPTTPGAPVENPTDGKDGGKDNPPVNPATPDEPGNTPGGGGSSVISDPGTTGTTGTTGTNNTGAVQTGQAVPATAILVALLTAVAALATYRRRKRD